MSFEKPTLEHWLVSAIMITIVGFAFNSYFGAQQRISAPKVLSTQKIIAPIPNKLEEKVIMDINETRRANNLPLLELDYALMSNASAYADQLATKCTTLKHSNLNKYLGDAVANLPILKYGENLALHISSLDSALTQLKQSPSHYATMNGDYTHAGVAVLKSTNEQCYGSIFVVQHFAKVSQ